MRNIKIIKSEKNPCWEGYEMVGMKEKDGKQVPNCVPKKESNEIIFSLKEAAKWKKKKEHENPEGGLNEKGRKSYEKATGGDLKPPVSKEEAKDNPDGKKAKRRKSFCSRMCGMKSKMTGEEKKKDPDSRINKSLRKWDCKCK